MDGVTTMGNAKYIGRVGALAVALGVGIAVANSPGVALAEPADSGPSSAPDASSSSSLRHSGATSTDTSATSSSTSTDPGRHRGPLECARPDGPEQFRRPRVVANGLHPGRSRAGGGGRADAFGRAWCGGRHGWPAHQFLDSLIGRGGNDACRHRTDLDAFDGAGEHRRDTRSPQQ